MTEVREVTELITPGPAEALAGLLGVSLPGEGLPLLWHGVYLLDRPPQAALGPDGHPARGGIPVPPGPGLRRMFAGGRVSRSGPLRTGAEATRRTWQAGATVKQGRSGPLHFVTVRTEISQGGQVVIAEEQDLVYREAATSDPPRSAEIELEPAGHGDWAVEVNPVLLFRFSALTYNAHRIHYDREYARAEGYPGLVVHGPLQALLMAELARPGLPDRCEYSYRLVAPLFDDQGLIVSAVPDPGPDAGSVRVSCRDAGGRVTAAGVIRPALRGPGSGGPVAWFDAQLVEQAAQPADLVAQPVQGLGHRGELGMRGRPLRLAGGLAGSQPLFLVAQGGRGLVVLGAGRGFLAPLRLPDLPIQVTDLRTAPQALLDGCQLGSDRLDVVADLGLPPARLPARLAEARPGGQGRRLLALVFVQHLDDLLAHQVQVRAQRGQDLRRDPVALADQAEQEVLGADVVVTELLRLAQRQLEHLLGPRRVGDLLLRLLLAPADDLLDLLAHGVQADPQRFEGLRRDALALADEAEQDVLGTDVIVMERPGFFFCQDDGPSRPVGKPLKHPARRPSRPPLDLGSRYIAFLSGG
jgi:3-methylfumaryl-CoA hydratase